MVTLSPRKRAFTLIELLIVITIIGILAVALVPRLTGGPSRARDAQRKSDLQQIATALEFYAQDIGGYPASSACTSGLSLSSYLTVTPVDPSSIMSGTLIAGGCTTVGSSGYSYIALQPDTSNTYAEGYLLIARSESTTEVSATGIYYTATTSTTWTPTTSSANATATYNLTGTGKPTQCTSTTSCTATVGRFYMIGR